MARLWLLKQMYKAIQHLSQTRLKHASRYQFEGQKPKRSCCFIFLERKQSQRLNIIRKESALREKDKTLGRLGRGGKGEGKGKGLRSGGSY
ncbi:unnamed protein product [Strongylus vulgaris]|uniref:Uncharacterized protein n=1 Tax=Strongylus vulgaris TaxID=40348 RepID=A0A3P7J6J4_STRVU|nr:unnamed protein product [Strongylus vulgaris]